DRAPDLALELLELVGVGLAKLLGRYFGVAYRRDGRAAAASENVCDAPDPEADDKKADNGGHDGFAEPIGRGFAETSKHKATTLKRLGKRLGRERIIGMHRAPSNHAGLFVRR